MSDITNKLLEMDRRRPFKAARSDPSKNDGWAYVNGGSITVLASADHNNLITSVRITRRQMLRALELMDKRQ